MTRQNDYREAGMAYSGREIERGICADLTKLYDVSIGRSACVQAGVDQGGDMEGDENGV